MLQRLNPDTPVLATTATANARVVGDVAEQLGAGTLVLRGALDRESLVLSVLELPNAAERLAWLADHLPELPGSGIVYTLTVAATDEVAAFLEGRGIRAVAYSGRSDDAERRAAEDDLLANRIKVLVATSALGMGFDKPDLGFVVHLGAPPSPIAYYQQIGRAGRGTDDATVVLLPATEDRDIWAYFASLAFPREELVRQTLSVLAGSEKPMSTAGIETYVELNRNRLETMLKVLDVDGAVHRVRGGWVSAGQPWTYDAARYERIAIARQVEQQHMLDYEATTGCRMEFLQRTLDDGTAAACGRCDNCAGAWYPTGVADGAAASADASLARVGVPIEPRAQWPTGADRLGIPLKGNIPPGERVDEGRALARLTDLGWGGVLRTLFEGGGEDAPITDALREAAIRVLADWPWAQRPASVLAVPSRRRPLLIGSLARGLADAGRLPLLGTLPIRGGGPSCEPGGNSVFRLAGLWDRFDASTLEIPQGPVLLVDDVADSRWTLTVAGRELRRAGASAVLPFTLALRA
jgi:ATP-dependent DNA helicase RecQ